MPAPTASATCPVVRYVPPSSGRASTSIVASRRSYTSRGTSSYGRTVMRGIVGHGLAVAAQHQQLDVVAGGGVDPVDEQLGVLPGTGRSDQADAQRARAPGPARPRPRRGRCVARAAISGPQWPWGMTRWTAPRGEVVAARTASRAPRGCGGSRRPPSPPTGGRGPASSGAVWGARLCWVHTTGTPMARTRLGHPRAPGRRTCRSATRASGGGTRRRWRTPPPAASASSSRW